MAFDSFAAFIAMEGHGPYVWTCYGVFVLLMGWLAVWSLRQRKAVARAQLRQLQRLEAGTRTVGREAAAASFTRINPS